MAGESVRGSDFLAARYTEQDLDDLLAFFESADVKVVGLTRLGTTAADGVSGIAQVPVDQVPTVVGGLLGQGINGSWQVLGLGAYDIVHLSFQAGPTRLRKR
jgi:hypothetical protein